MAPIITLNLVENDPKFDYYQLVENLSVNRPDHDLDDNIFDLTQNICDYHQPKKISEVGRPGIVVPLFTKVSFAPHI